MHQDGNIVSRVGPPQRGSGLVSSTMDLAGNVDTFTGAGAQKGLPFAYSGGETFPGADMPFGMVQWSPDTVTPAYSGYKYSDNRIRGFSLTHLSGAGCYAYGDLPFYCRLRAPLRFRPRLILPVILPLSRMMQKWPIQVSTK